MKTLILLLSLLGYKVDENKILYRTEFNWNERVFIHNVIDLAGKEPEEIYRLDNGKIAVNFNDQRITLGQDGFIHGLEIYEQGKWIDLGPEY